MNQIPDEFAEPAVPERPPATTGKRFAGVVGRLTSINVVVRSFGLITGPLIARALGPDGRGELAAILAPLMFVPIIAMLGLAQYATREVARATQPGAILGTIGAVLLAIGALGTALAVPLAEFFADGRQTVETFLIVGFAILPVSLIGQLLIAVTVGMEEWGSVMLSRLIPPVMGLIGVVGLYAAGALTVASAATVTIVSSVAQIAPGLFVAARRSNRLRVSRRLAKDGLSFGLKAWATQLSSSLNARLDQVMMVRLVPSRELGLYAVGVNAASVAPLFTQALVVPLAVRVARGDAHLVGRALRTALAASAVIAAILAVLVPVALPLLFGPAFSDAVIMTQILLVAGIPGAGSAVLTSSLAAAGRPGPGAAAQVVGLAITIPGLLIALPALGGKGAALVTAVVSSAIFASLLPVGKREFRLPLSELLIPRVRDVRWALDQLPRRRRRG